jgi:TfoX/Sxy family transcriptional regulator of competence genes
MSYHEELADRVRRAFHERNVAVEEKRMMGGLCFMVDGKMCVGVEKTRLMVRLDPAIYDESLRRKGCGPMDFTGRPMRGFVFVSDDGLTSHEDLSSWVALALEFNPRARSSRKKSITPAMPAPRGKHRKARRRNPANGTSSAG